MTKGSSAARQDLRKRRGLSKLEQGYMGFVLILPWLIGFCIFKLYPFVSSLVYSFTDYDLFRGVQNVVGFQNYIDAFTKAKNVKALKVTFTYAFMTVPLKLIFALFIAYILNFKIKGVGLFRTAYYVPSILGGSVAIAVLWKALFKNDGVVNTILTMLGFESVSYTHLDVYKRQAMSPTSSLYSRRTAPTRARCCARRAASLRCGVCRWAWRRC